MPVCDKRLKSLGGQKGLIRDFTTTARIWPHLSLAAPWASKVGPRDQKIPKNTILEEKWDLEDPFKTPKPPYFWLRVHGTPPGGSGKQRTSPGGRVGGL